MVNTMIKTSSGGKSLFRAGTWRQEKAIGETLGPMACSVQLVFLDNPGPPCPEVAPPTDMLGPPLSIINQEVASQTSYKPIWWMHFLNFCSLIPNDPGCVKLTKQNQANLKNHSAHPPLVSSIILGIRSQKINMNFEGIKPYSNDSSCQPGQSVPRCVVAGWRRVNLPVWPYALLVDYPNCGIRCSFPV